MHEQWMYGSGTTVVKKGNLFLNIQNNGDSENKSGLPFSEQL